MLVRLTIKQLLWRTKCKGTKKPRVLMWVCMLSKWWSGVSLSVVVHRGLVFMEHLVVSTQCHTEDNGCHILKAVNPFFPLWSLSPHIKQPGDGTSHTFRTHEAMYTHVCTHTKHDQIESKLIMHSKKQNRSTKDVRCAPSQRNLNFFNSLCI